MIEYQHDHEHLSLLLDIMDTANRAGDQYALAEQALERMLHRNGVIAAGFWMREGADLARLAQRNLSEPIPRAAITQVIETCEPVYSIMKPDSSSSPYLAVLPLKLAGACTGALAVVVSAAPAPDQRLALQAIAAHLGAAIENVRLRQHNVVDSDERDWEQFLSHAAHEIKNPLASIKGYADLMLRRAAKDPSDPTHKGLTTISQQVARTTALLEQLSDIGRIGTNRLHIDRHEAHLNEIVRDAVQEYQSTTDHHQLLLDNASSPISLRLDAIRIGQVVGAMLSNAIKFSPDGGPIAVRLWRSQEAGSQAATLSVNDRGVGVPSGEQERVFERFFRGSNIRGSFSGMGVGLYIARAIVGLHNGRMWLESDRRNGTTCYTLLPLV
jgi:signal transduction histidine kinase